MFDFISKLHIFTLCLAIFIAGVNAKNLSFDSIDIHLNHYAQYNNSHHDNIDDEPHSHTHKHSEDGDEHEHKHEHQKSSSTEYELTRGSFTFISLSVTFSSGFYSIKNLSSDPHLKQLFRPPIV